MVATGTRKLSGGAKKTWLVRNEQGETFGPVEMEALTLWACDGRLAPTNEVSEDGVVWRLATSCRALAMDWVAEVTPGSFYGPIHKRAMEELVKDGSIAAVGAFFVRRALGANEAATSEEAAARISELTSLAERARQDVAECKEELLATRRQAADREAELLETLRLAVASAAQAEQARGQAVEEIQFVREQASARERLILQEAAEREEQARHQAAAFAEQLKAAQQQQLACSAQAEQVRQQAAQADAQAQQQLAALREQLQAALQKQVACEALAEQARRAEREGADKLNALASEVAGLQRAREDALAKAAEYGAARDASVAERESLTRAFAAERKELQHLLGRTQAEAEKREQRLAALEHALSGAEGADAERGALAAQVHGLRAEISGLQHALSGEKDAVLQAHARCAVLEAALAEAKAGRGDMDAAAGQTASELRLMRQQIEALCQLVRESEQARDARVHEAAGSASTRVYVEAVPVDVLPPNRPSGSPSSRAAEPAEPEKRRRPAEDAPSSASLSMAQLEQQARRELERLGAQGANLFKRKK